MANKDFDGIVAGLTHAIEIAEGRAAPARPPADDPGEDAPFDADNPEWTDEMFARTRPPEGQAPKVAIKLRLDAEVVENFKAAGPGWQTRMNEVLAQAVHLGGKT